MIYKNSITRKIIIKDNIEQHVNNINIGDISDPGLKELFLLNFTEEEIISNEMFMDILYKNFCALEEKEMVILRSL